MKKEKKKIIITLISISIICLIIGLVMANQNPQVKIETSMGNIIVELYPNKSPVTVENFLKYVDNDFYSNTVFHRIIEDFMIQCGGFQSNGTEKTTLAPIVLESKNGLKNEKGTLAMARTTVENSATSQFFINLQDNEFLNYGYRDAGYAVFGKVVKGLDVVEKIGSAKTTVKYRMEDWPVEDIVIKSIKRI